MISSNKKGIWLCQVEEQKNGDFVWLVQLAESLLGSWAVTVLILQISGVWELEGARAMGVAATMVCILHTLLRRLRLESWFYPGVLAACLLLTLIFRTELLEGFRLMFTRLSLAYTGATGRAMVMLSAEEVSPSPAMCVGIAAVVFGCAAACLCCGAEKGGKWILSLLLSGGVLAGAVMLKAQVSVFVLTAAVLLLLNAPDSSGGSIRVLRWCVCLLMGLALTAAVMMPGVQRKSREFSRLAHEKFHNHTYETPEDPLPEGDFSNYQDKEPTSQPVLTVTLEHPQALYLRGFVGCTFEEDGWTPVDNQILAKNRDLLYWLNQKEFHPAAQFAAAAALQNRQRSQVTVQNILACSQYAYVPYGIYADGFAQYLPAEDLRTDSVYAEGQRNYMYSIVSGGTEEIGDILTRLQSSTEESTLSFRRAESAYREFVYNHYLQVAPEVRELLQERWDSCARGYGEAGELTSQQAQECALYFLEQCFPEEGTEEILPLDVAKGSSYQKATVAAMTLRYYGVPARYAEGYIITAEMAVAAGENGSISVRGTDAGAWVEVYQDGIGWIPMELTPGMGETIREETYSSVRSDEAEQKQGTKTEEKEKEEETDRPDGGTLVRLKRILNWSLLILPLLLLALIVLLILRRRYLLRCRAARFGSESCRDAVGWIFRDAVCLLGHMGFDRGNGSLETLCPPVEARFGQEYAMKLKSMIDLNGKAVFSSREMPHCARDNMLEFYGITLSYLKETSSWMKKLWLKWILCLY